MRLAAAALLTILAAATTASAQGPHPACAADVERFCHDVAPGGGRIITCLREHTSEVSAGCQEALAAWRQGRGAKMRRWFRRCQEDAGKFCKEVPPGQGRIVQCLLSHSDQLSTSCKAALETRPAAQAAKTPAAPAAAVTPAATPEAK